MLEQQAGIQAKAAAEPRKSVMRGRMLTGTPPTEVEFSPLLISSPGTLVTERPANKDCMMLEQQAGIQAKTAGEPRKSSNAGPYVDGDTSNRVRVFAAVALTPGDTCHRKALEQQAGIQAKTTAEPRKSSNAAPYVDGDTSNRVRVFADVNITPGVTCHRKAGQKGPLDA
jgi:uncharacterized protein YciI